MCRFSRISGAQRLYGLVNMELILDDEFNSEHVGLGSGSTTCQLFDLRQVT